jgi:hypothetical protein
VVDRQKFGPTDQTDPTKVFKTEIPLLDLTSNQIKHIEENHQSSFDYKPGLCGCTTVDPDDVFNPIRIYNFGCNDIDFIPKNIAIAKIGNVLTYWRLYKEALETGKMDFYRQGEYGFVPVLNDKGEYFPKTLENFSSRICVFPNREKYEHHILMTNYAGDADFVGLPYLPIRTDINIKLGSQDISVSRKSIGISKNLTKKVLNADTNISRISDKEIGEIILGGLSNFNEITQLLVKDTLEREGTIAPYQLMRTWMKTWNQFSDIDRIDAIVEELREHVNAVYSEDPLSFETISAVNRMVESMQVMYSHAARYYQE